MLPHDLLHSCHDVVHGGLGYLHEHGVLVLSLGFDLQQVHQGLHGDALRETHRNGVVDNCVKTKAAST